MRGTAGLDRAEGLQEETDHVGGWERFADETTAGLLPSGPQQVGDHPESLCGSGKITTPQRWNDPRETVLSP